MSSIKPEDNRNPEGEANSAIYRTLSYLGPTKTLLALGATITMLYGVPAGYDVINDYIESPFAEVFTAFGAGTVLGIFFLVGYAIEESGQNKMESDAQDGWTARRRRLRGRRR